MGIILLIKIVPLRLLHLHPYHPVDWKTHGEILLQMPGVALAPEKNTELNKIEIITIIKTPHVHAWI